MSRFNKSTTRVPRTHPSRRYQVVVVGDAEDVDKFEKKNQSIQLFVPTPAAVKKRPQPRKTAKENQRPPPSPLLLNLSEDSPDEGQEDGGVVSDATSAAHDHDDDAPKMSEQELRQLADIDDADDFPLFIEDAEGRYCKDVDGKLVPRTEEEIPTFMRPENESKKWVNPHRDEQVQRHAAKKAKAASAAAKAIREVPEQAEHDDSFAAADDGAVGIFMSPTMPAAGEEQHSRMFVLPRVLPTLGQETPLQRFRRSIQHHVRMGNFDRRPLVLETAVLKKICTPEVTAGAQPRQRKVGERVERKTSTIIVPSTTSVVTTEDPATKTIVLTTGGTSSPSARTVTTSTRTNKGRGGEMKHQPELVIVSSTESVIPITVKKSVPTTITIASSSSAVTVTEKNTIGTPVPASGLPHRLRSSMAFNVDDVFDDHAPQYHSTPLRGDGAPLPRFSVDSNFAFSPAPGMTSTPIDKEKTDKRTSKDRSPLTESFTGKGIEIVPKRRSSGRRSLEHSLKSIDSSASKEQEQIADVNEPTKSPAASPVDEAATVATEEKKSLPNVSRRKTRSESASTASEGLSPERRVSRTAADVTDTSGPRKVSLGSTAAARRSRDNAEPPTRGETKLKRRRTLEDVLSDASNKGSSDSERSTKEKDALSDAEMRSLSSENDADEETIVDEMAIENEKENTVTTATRTGPRARTLTSTVAGARTLPANQRKATQAAAGAAAATRQSLQVPDRAITSTRTRTKAIKALPLPDDAAQPTEKVSLQVAEETAQSIVPPEASVRTKRRGSVKRASGEGLVRTVEEKIHEVEDASASGDQQDLAKTTRRATRSSTRLSAQRDEEESHHPSISTASANEPSPPKTPGERRISMAAASTTMPAEPSPAAAEPEKKSKIVAAAVVGKDETTVEPADELLFDEEVVAGSMMMSSTFATEDPYAMMSNLGGVGVAGASRLDERTLMENATTFGTSRLPEATLIEQANVTTALEATNQTITGDRTLAEFEDATMAQRNLSVMSAYNMTTMSNLSIDNTQVLKRNASMSMLVQLNGQCPYYLEDYMADPRNPDSALNELLHVIGQEKVMPWKALPKDVLSKPKKLGEGTYAEVFATNYNGNPVALKIMPFTGDEVVYAGTVNGEHLQEAATILPEILITKELSSLNNPAADYHTPNFVRLENVNVVKGVFPAPLMKAWDKFATDKGSENDRPDYAKKEQLFITIALENAGTDLEKFVLKDESQLVSVLLQLAMSLTVAEACLEFEHRDMHVGNVLVKDVKDAHIEYKYMGQKVKIKSGGVKSTVIDFTLSRMRKQNAMIYKDLEADEELFGGPANELQFDTYRAMREANGKDWREFTPRTNLLWLFYMSRQLITKQECKKKILKKRKDQLQAIFDRVLDLATLNEMWTSDAFFSLLNDYMVIEA